jgi:hypothetical protein
MTPTTPSPHYGPTPDQLFAGCQCVEAAGGFDGFVGEVAAEVKTAVLTRAGDISAMTDDQVLERLNGITTDIVERRLMPDIKREIRRAIDADLAAKPLRGREDAERRIDAVENRVAALMELRFDALARALKERRPFDPTPPEDTAD